ncbi:MULTISPECIES: glycosyltransferase family 61 protein [Halomonas]|uniref:glycosyltransferase family 61 protein n=1 Tax=Halomonas TaxID=2745 RepID=UPI000ECBA77B|nr:MULTISPECIES: glycosyltransferase family 61 protein [Halomonas]HCR98453.1 hypothetical protein [Halomonas sp.]
MAGIYPIKSLACLVEEHSDVSLLSSDRSITSYRRPSNINIRGKKKAFLETFKREAGAEVITPEVQHWQLSDATTIDQGIIITASGFVVEESLADYPKELSNERFDIRNEKIYIHSEKIDEGSSGSFLKKRGQTNFGHWIVELLTKHYFLKEVRKKDIQAIVHHAQHDFLKDMYVDSLSLLDTPANAVQRVGYNHTVVPVLDYVTGISQHPYRKSYMLKNMRDHIVSNIEKECWEEVEAEGLKIFVTRNITHKRNIINIEEVESYFSSKGYVFVEPQSLSFIEQVNLFSKASVVVGIMGAAMCNAIWANANCNVGYIASEAMDGKFYYDQESALGRSNFNLLNCERTKTSSSLLDDIKVDMNELKAWLADVENS